MSAKKQQIELPCVKDREPCHLVLKALKADIAAGRASGPPKPADDIFDRLETKYAPWAR